MRKSEIRIFLKQDFRFLKVHSHRKLVQRAVNFVEPRQVYTSMRLNNKNNLTLSFHTSKKSLSFDTR